MTLLPETLCIDVLSWEERSAIYETRSRFVSAILDLDRENKVRSSRQDISCFLFDSEGYRAKLTFYVDLKNERLLIIDIIYRNLKCILY
ncbi:hypothetical protein PUN28_003010 [Cardiocondyla obscurior]|uniref:Uncharacterized protein n=1 Tax=Cardiocondyla obscurior TaxID=286306 RepID=A0AAW2GXD0_9HYME